MDMQTKLICNYQVYYNNRFMQMRENDKYKPEILINKNLYPNGDLGCEVIEFTEHTRVEITLVSNDSNAVLEIESYNGEDIITAKVGESIVVSPGMEQDNMLVPGEYSITIRTKDQIYEGMYKVAPSSIEEESLVNIRKYLEKIIKGLSYNIYTEKNRHKGGKSIEHTAFIFEVYKYMEGNWDNLISSINAIIDNPIIDIDKKYDKKCYSRKPDNKSQRWLSKKGQIYNSNPYVVNIYCEKHSELTYDSIENKILKKIIDYIYNILIDLCKNYSDGNEEFNNKIYKLEDQIRESEIHYNKIKDISYVQKAKFDVKNKIVGLTKERDKYIKNHEIFKIYLDKLVKMRNLICHYKNETWIKDINNYDNICKPSLKILKHKDYSEIYEIYRNLYSMKENGKKDNSFPHKKTSVLFEIYSYILIKEMLEEIGFEWTDGWLKKMDNILLYNGDLLSNESIVLTMNEYKIELIYDKEIDKANSIKDSNKSQLVSTNSKSRRPDIVLNLYKDDTFISSCIVEVKCRKKRYIYNTSEDTDVMYQLTDYSSLKYYNGDTGKVLKESCIDKIVVVYPKQQGPCRFKDNLYDFSFVQVEPTNLDTKPYGYNELKGEISEFLIANGVVGL